MTHPMLPAPPPPAPAQPRQTLAPAARIVFHTLLWVGLILAIVAMIYAITGQSQSRGMHGEGEIKAMLLMNSSTQWLTWAVTSLVGSMIVLGCGARVGKHQVRF